MNDKPNPATPNPDRKVSEKVVYTMANNKRELTVLEAE